MSVSPTHDHDFEKERGNQKLFCCVRWMSSETRSYKFLWGEDLKLEKRFWERAIWMNGRMVAKEKEELKLLLM